MATTDTERHDGAAPVAAAGPRDATAGRTAAATEYASEGARIIADPAPLGLGGFALTTFLLCMVNAGFISAKTAPIVLGVALAYGGIAQLLAGMWEFRKGNTFGSTAFTAYGAFWISFWAWDVFYAKEVANPGDRGTAAGWYLIAWGIFTLIMLAASFRTTSALALLFTLLTLTFFVLAFGALGGDAAGTGLTRIGGWLGILTAAVAWYACMAGVLSATFGRPVLPNPPLRRS